MHVVTHPTQRALSLVEIIDFKWLMAGDGHRVHVEQLQADRDYACACVALAARSRVPALRETAARLACLLGMPAPGAAVGLSMGAAAPAAAATAASPMRP